MSTFNTSDYQNIVDILRLPLYELEDGSTLRDRGSSLEEQDARLNLNNVGKVKQAIIDYLAAQSAYETAIETDTSLGVTRQEVVNEYVLEWGARGSDMKYNNLVAGMRRHEEIIRRYLQWDQTSPYNGRTMRAHS